MNEKKNKWKGEEKERRWDMKNWKKKKKYRNRYGVECKTTEMGWK